MTMHQIYTSELITHLRGQLEAARRILCEQEPFRSAARNRAEALFGLDQMVERYLDVLL